jgi:acyl carrier protein
MVGDKKMNKIIKKDLFNLIATALELPNGSIDDNSSGDNVDAWDSLGHLSILVLLDKHVDGKASKISDLAVATSVKKISKILTDEGMM